MRPVDILSGGTPCTEISEAGLKTGIRQNTKSGLWLNMAQAIDTIKPSIVIWENVTGAYSTFSHSNMEPSTGLLGNPDSQPVLRTLGRVLGDLATLGYDAEWINLPANHIGACHRRERVFIYAWHPHRVTADTDSIRFERPIPKPQPNLGGNDKKLLPTVTATDAKGGRGYRFDGTPYSRNSGVTLTDCVATSLWENYLPAITHHQQYVTGTPPPDPTVGGNPKRLNRRFVEWMLDLPEGHTDMVANKPAIRSMGNTVMVKQAAYALQTLVNRAR